MPIIGHGDIASVIVDRPDQLFFASGVSNSREDRESEYQREKDLLISMPRDLQLVYFGSLSVFYSKTRYTHHKLEMESLVKQEFPRYCIVRLGNITWGNNPHTLINAFRNKMRESEPIEIRETTRYIINKEEFLHWMNLIPEWNCEMSITGEPLSIREIVKRWVI